VKSCYVLLWTLIKWLTVRNVLCPFIYITTKPDPPHLHLGILYYIKLFLYILIVIKLSYFVSVPVNVTILVFSLTKNFEPFKIT
jgi:hypothetical protein